MKPKRKPWWCRINSQPQKAIRPKHVTDASWKYGFKMKRSKTAAEYELWMRLRAFPELDIHGSYALGPFIVDFYWPEYRIAIEVDGPSHDGPKAQAKDARRTTYLKDEHGVHIIRYQNDDVYLDADYVAAEIINYLRDFRPRQKVDA